MTLGVKRPDVEIVPPVAVHVTLVLVVPVTVAVNCVVVPISVVVVVGETETTTGEAPVPASDTLAFAELLVIATDPVKLPVAIGANEIGKTVEPFAGIVIGNVDPARLKLVPVTVAAVTKGITRCRSLRVSPGAMNSQSWWKTTGRTRMKPASMEILHWMKKGSSGAE